MAYITFQPSDYFNSVLWTGNNDTVGATRSITGVGFAPDWIWSKNRTDTISHSLFDRVRGAGNTKLLKSNSTDGETGNTNAALYGYVSSFDNDGFTMTNGTDTGGNAAVLTQRTGHNYVAWNWLANGSGSANTDGTISSTVSANDTAGFSIVKYTGTGSAGNVGHGLSTAPKVLINKALGVQDWIVGHSSIGFTKFLKLNATNAESTNSGIWNDTAPTTDHFTINSGNGNTNATGVEYITYCFAEKKGFSKFMGWSGNGSTDGTFLYTGFKPALFIYKVASGTTGGWGILDNKRDTFNPVDNTLVANGANAEFDDHDVDFCANGLKIRSGGGNINLSGATYIGMAFAEEPIVSSNDIPGVAR